VEVQGEGSRLGVPTSAPTAFGGAWVFLVAFSLRFLFVIYDGGLGYQPKADSLDFHLIALSLVGGTGYSRLSWDLSWQPTAYRMPLTPIFLAAVYKAVGVRPFVARIVFAAIGACAAVLVYLACKQLFGQKHGRAIGSLAGVLFAIDPFMITNQTLILLEPLHVFLVCAAMWATASYAASRRAALLWLMSAIAGLLALARPDGFAYGIAMAVAAALLPLSPEAATSVKRSGLRGAGEVGNGEPTDAETTGEPGRCTARIPSGAPKPGACRSLLLDPRVKSAAIVVAGILVALLPWSFRNYLVFHRFIPLSTASGDLLLGANNRATYSFGPFHGYWAYGALTTGEAGSYGFAGELQADSKRRSLALKHIRDHPLEAVAVVPFRIARGWELYDPVGNARFGEAWGRPLWATYAALVLYYPGVALALYGAWLLRKYWRKMALLYALPIYLTVLFAVATGEPRYRAGVQPVIWIFCSVALYELARRKMQSLGTLQASSDALTVLN
jgi:hypothetical protein